MDEREFEDQLRTRLHARLDAAEPDAALAERVGHALRSREPSHRGHWLELAVVVAAAALLVAFLGLNGIFGAIAVPGATPSAATTVSPPGSSPSPTGVPAPSAVPSSSAVPTPPGSVPPGTSAAWTGLSITRISAGPTAVASVVDWSGGYLALPPTGDSGDPPSPAWISRDGRTWVALPADQFNPPGASGLPSQEQAAPCLGGVFVATATDTGERLLWYSTDGRTWLSHQLPPLVVLTGAAPAANSMMAGNATGIVAVENPDGHSVAFSADCLTWKSIVLPGAADSTISGVASFGAGFIAIGEAGATSSGTPMAWVSADGQTWKSATVQRLPGDAFISVMVGFNGLAAESFTGTVPGIVTFWTSPDGRSWKTSRADPMGINQDGEGVGSADGLFTADGARILAFGSRSGSQQTEYWVSLDGGRWTKLSVSGDTASVSSGVAQPFLLHDGVFFNDGSQSWFGAALR